MGPPAQVLVLDPLAALASRTVYIFWVDDKYTWSYFVGPSYLGTKLSTGFYSKSKPSTSLLMQLKKSFESIVLVCPKGTFEIEKSKQVEELEIFWMCFQFSKWRPKLIRAKIRRLNSEDWMFWVSAVRLYSIALYYIQLYFILILVRMTNISLF